MAADPVKNQRLGARVVFAWAGLCAAWRSERSFRTQCIMALMASGVMGVLQPRLVWWALVGMAIVLVLAAELINTALEQLADHLHPEHHPRIKIVKDCAAAAVLLLSLGAAWVGVLMVFSTLNN